jgi:FkbM family methyltransferase
MPILRAVLPEGLVRLDSYRNRFKVLELPSHFCLKRRYRKAIDTVQLDLVPPEIRHNLKCVVDVGANVGEWSIGIASLTKAKKIIAFEPVPEVFMRLKEKTKLFPQIYCKNTALGSSTGETKMNVGSITELSSILTLRQELGSLHGVNPENFQQVVVPITTLDQELEEEKEISLLKIDVEGYESEVLAGAKAVLNRTKVLIIEITYAPYYHGDNQFTTLHQIITSMSPLKLYGISHPRCSPSGQPLWADAIYCNQ